MRDKRKKILPTVTVCVLVSAPAVFGQDPRPGDSGYEGPEPPQQLTGSHFGSSPFDPPEVNDMTFVVDRADGLDTGCAFRSQGPLIFTVEIDRVVGDKATLVQNGLMSPTATLRMPAFDVDFDASVAPFNPERDLVRINGHRVPNEYLTGQNNTWKLNTFEVPVDWVNFPADPGRGREPRAATNVIRIDIDVANTDEVWCTEIDWAALSIEVARPVVMAHGIFSSGNRAWSNFWVPELTRLGLPNSNRLNMGALDSIRDNARKVAVEVAESKRRWGVDKVVLLAHSKGGLDSRHYAEDHDDVAQVIQLGTPNAGSRLADIAQGILLVGLGLPRTALVNGLAGPAGVQLTRPYMKFYNLFHGANPNVYYTALAGDYDPDCPLLRPFCRGLDSIGLFLSGSPGDTVVTVSSVHALAYTDDRKVGSRGSDRQATHGGLHDSRRVFNKVRDRIGDTSKRASITALKARLSRSEGPAEEAEEKASAPELSTTGAVAGEIRQGEIQVHSLSLDESVPSAVTLFFPSGDLDLVLISPSGVVIDPAFAQAAPDVDWQERAVEGGRSEVYGLSQPEVGTWTLRVSAASVVEPSGSAAYAAVAFFEDPGLTFTAEMERENVSVGDPLLLRATLLGNGGPPADASVRATVALPDGSEQTLKLRDNGTGADTVAGDGVYSVFYVATSQSGNYRVCFEATRTGSSAGPDFSRSTFAMATVAASESTFTGAFVDFGLDSDSDGRFDELVIEADVAVTVSAEYRVFAVLEDARGNRLEADATLNLAPGLDTASVAFDGEDLFLNGVDGPYSLAEIRLAEVGANEILPVDDVADAHHTAGYSFGQFQHGPVELTGNGTAAGVDTNGNGLFDRLDVRVEVRVDFGGFYEWSTRLIDSSGRELGFAAASALFSAGANELTVSFDGLAIGQSGSDGPYFVTDLLLVGGGTSLVRFKVFETPPFSVTQFEGGQPLIFRDGFESGDIGSWSGFTP